MSRRVKIVTVVRLVGLVHPSAYYDHDKGRPMTDKEIIDYERDASKEDKLQQVVENIEISDEVEVLTDVSFVECEIDSEDYEEDDDA